ncbi:MAG TPA: phytase [Candidatus Limnocylindria bacterium]|nr:phytase [Candidatus Limnocylindria bacterium]
MIAREQFAMRVTASGFRRALLAALILVPVAGASDSPHGAPLPVRATLRDPAIEDQDDMCIWVHPKERALSTVITSDKTAGKLFVYDLQGRTIQVLPVRGKPGNIDLRYGFPLAGARVDIVAFNDRRLRTIEVYRVDPNTRRLHRVDDGAIATGANYGLCLYRSARSGNFFAFSTAENGTIGQYRLRDEGGKVAASRVRTWDLGGQTEGCVCDDETGIAYFGEEDAGIWKIGAEPGQVVKPAPVAKVGDASGLTADVEGLTLYLAAGGRGYLIASSQGSDDFKVYERKPPHRYVKNFKVAGVATTDGIDVTSAALGSRFPTGLLAVHNAVPKKKTVELCSYGLGLPIDTLHWNPRKR